MNEILKFIPAEIPDVLIIEPQVFEDSRGFFMETWQAQKFAKAGIGFNFVQENYARSKQSTLRGFHYQIQQAQGKLIMVVAGEIFDVAVDIRCSSPTFGRWAGVRLSAHEKRQMWIPPGFAHGYFVISDWAEVLYKATDFYDPQAERCIKWDDPTLNVHWPIEPGKSPILSPKDLAGKMFKDAEVYE